MAYNTEHEIEAKFKITEDQAENLKFLLRENFKYSRLEVNEFYDTKKRKLDKKDEVLRIRSIVNQDKSSSVIVTFKGKPVKSRFKCRPEYETKVESGNNIRAIIKALGYTKYFSFEKKRQNYDFGGCSVEIDLIPQLGYFCEIEGIDEEIIESVRINLGLSDLKPIKDGYGMLLWKHLKKTKCSDKEVKFIDEAV